jgi:hypothetical protein
MVYYLSYGSNMFQERFLNYIFGGKLKGTTICNRGCTVKTPPSSSLPVIVNRNMYFARYGSSWNGAPAFLDIQTKSFDSDLEVIVGEKLQSSFYELSRFLSDKSIISLCRMYLVTKSQFLEVVKQENLNHSFEFDLTSFGMGPPRTEKVLNSFYGHLIYLGSHQGYPIFTFSSENDFSNLLHVPSSKYLTVIAQGLKETFQITDDEIISYFRSRPGFDSSLNEQQIKEILTNQNPFCE